MKRFGLPMLDLLRVFTPQGARGHYIKLDGSPEAAEGTVYLGKVIQARRPDGSIAVINHFEYRHASSWTERRQYFLSSTRRIGGLLFLVGYYKEPFWKWPLVEPQEGDYYPDVLAADE